MKKETTRTKRQAISRNGLIIGEIQMESTTLSMDDLINKVITLLQDDTIKLYLGLVQQKRLSFSGVG